MTARPLTSTRRIRYTLALSGLAWISASVGCGSVAYDLSSTRDDVLSQYFTDEAIQLLEDVPVRCKENLPVAGIALGDDLVGGLVGTALGLGGGRQIAVLCVSERNTMIHELVHQADALGLIDLIEFDAALERMRDSEVYGETLRTVEETIRGEYEVSLLGAIVLTDERLRSELRATLIADWATHVYPLPDDFLKVYDRVLRIDYIRDRIP